MPLSFTSTAGGTAYVDIRVGNAHNVHQMSLAGASLTADAEGYVAPGTPVLAAGGPVTGASQTVVGIVGPEAVKKAAGAFFGNVFLDGVFNTDAIEDNLGRALSANELSALAAGGFKLV